MMKRLLLLFLCTSIYVGATAQSFWFDIEEARIEKVGERQIVPAQYRTVRCVITDLRNQLASVSVQSSSAVLLDLPMPDGTQQRFRVWESPVMQPRLAARYAHIKTYAGQGVDDPTATVRFDITDFGFHAMMIGQAGTVYIDPYTSQNTLDYICYTRQAFYENNKKRFEEQAPLGEVNDTPRPPDQMNMPGSSPMGGTLRTPHDGQLRTYRLAMATTGEYSAYFQGTASNTNVMSAVVSAINRVNQVYERDVAVHLNLVDNTDTLFFYDSATDPYNNNNGAVMLGQNQTTVTSRIGSANYDIGHVFSTGGGGIAQLKAPCNNSIKAMGVTGLPQPVGDPFYIDFVAHEMGHQFGANHTFNGNQGSCQGNGSSSTAYEPGSGTTIMGYAGICYDDDIASHSDDYFHLASLEEITNNIITSTGNTCPEKTPTNNNVPVVTVGTGGFTIPKSTPFMLTGSATDSDGDMLSYCWEEYDKGSFGSPTSPTGTAPLFRSIRPTASSTRFLPDLSAIITGNLPKGIVLPTYTRPLKFRLIARDNKIEGGSYSYAQIDFGATADAGPFVVTYPNVVETWETGTTKTITWDVANTNLAPVNCQKVHIILSKNGGFNFSDTLAMDVPNTGSADVVIPADAITNTGKIIVAAADNIFFDMSDVKVKIQQGTSTTQDVSMEQLIKITPNPADNLIMLDLGQVVDYNFHISLLNVHGQVISTQFLKAYTSDKLTMDVQTLPAGVYFVQFQTGRSVATKRVLVQH
jgi:hypothetical protein